MKFQYRVLIFIPLLFLVVLGACQSKPATPTQVIDPHATLTAIFAKNTQSAGAMMLTSLAIQPTADDATPTLMRLPTWTPTDEPSPAPTRTKKPNSTKPIPCESSTLLKSTIDPNKTIFSANDEFTIIWEVKNTGACAWKNGVYRIAQASDISLGADGRKLASDIQPGETLTIVFSMIAPKKVGTYTSAWKLQNPARVMFGDTMIVKITVVRLDVPTDVPATPTP